MLEVISLGAGVQSTTMALMAAHGEIEPMPDAAIFADTGSEPKAVYEHLDWLRSPNVLPFPVHVVQLSDLGDDILRLAAGDSTLRDRTAGYPGVPFFTREPNGNRGMLPRQCTQNYKLRQIEYCCKELLGRPRDKAIRSRKPLVRQWIGISADETHRVNWKGPKWLAKRYPLISHAISDDPQDIWMKRHDCKAWLVAHEYPIPPRSACTFCVFRDNSEWRWLRDNDDDGWTEAITVDRAIRHSPDVDGTGLNLGGELYLHADRIPLEEVDLEVDDTQTDMWAGECEGMCGL